VRTFRFDPQARAWTRPRPYGVEGYPRFTGDEAAAYTALGRLLLPPNGGDFRLRTYATPSTDLSASDLREYEATLTRGCTRAGLQPGGAPRYDTCPPPADAGVGVAPWTAVVNQISAELWAAAWVESQFDKLSKATLSLYQDNAGALPALDAQLKLPASVPDNGPQIAKLIKSTVEAAVDIPQLFPRSTSIGATVEKYREVIRGIAFLVHATGAVAEGAGLVRRTDPPGKWAEITARVARAQQEQKDLLTQQRRFVMGDYGLARTLGREVAGGLRPVDTQALISAGRRAFTETAYKAYLPAFWRHVSVENCLKGSALNVCSVPVGGNVRVTGKRCLPPSCQDAGQGVSEYFSFTAVLPRRTDANNTPVPYCTTFVVGNECRFPEIGPLWPLVVDEIPSSCRYDPDAQSTTVWRYGCPIGADRDAVAENRDGWALPDVRCDATGVLFDLCTGSGAATAYRADSIEAASPTLQRVRVTARHAGARAAFRARTAVVESLLLESPDDRPRELSSTPTGRRLDTPTRLRRAGATPNAVVFRGRVAGARLEVGIRLRPAGPAEVSLRANAIRVDPPQACGRRAQRVRLRSRILFPGVGASTSGRPVTLTGLWSCRRTGGAIALRGPAR
jgi:hypothetical protein